MKELDTYIIEKLKLNKDSKVESNIYIDTANYICSLLPSIPLVVQMSLRDYCEHHKIHKVIGYISDDAYDSIFKGISNERKKYLNRNYSFNAFRFYELYDKYYKDCKLLGRINNTSELLYSKNNILAFTYKDFIIIFECNPDD